MYRSKFKNGDFVFLITDSDQLRRQIIAITFNIGDSIIYTVTCGVDSSSHFENELSEDKVFF
jgi:hypothetical protein